jgi:hypothetical protein
MRVDLIGSRIVFEKGLAARILKVIFVLFHGFGRW